MLDEGNRNGDTAIVVPEHRISGLKRSTRSAGSWDEGRTQKLNPFCCTVYWILIGNIDEKPEDLCGPQIGCNIYFDAKIPDLAGLVGREGSKSGVMDFNRLCLSGE